MELLKFVLDKRWLYFLIYYCFFVSTLLLSIMEQHNTADWRGVAMSLPDLNQSVILCWGIPLHIHILNLYTEKINVTRTTNSYITVKPKHSQFHTHINSWQYCVGTLGLIIWQRRTSVYGYSQSCWSKDTWMYR